MASIEERIQAINNPPPPPPAEVQAEAPVEAVVEAPAEAPAEVPVEAPVEAPVEVVSEAAPEAEAPEAEAPEEIEINSFDDIARHLNVDVADLYKTKLTVSVDGEPKEVSIEEFKDRTYDAEKLARERREAQAIREAVQAQANEAKQRIERSILEAAELTTEAEKRLAADYEAINWNELREADPAEWTARRQEFDERQRQIQVAKDRVEARFSEHVGKQQAEAEAATQEHLAREFDLLKTAIPEWQDEGVMKNESAELRDYLAASGFKPNEIEQVVDHRLVVLLRKAQAYDKQRKDSAVTTKRVVKVGKTVRPGPARTKQQQAVDANKTLRTNLRKSGSTNDAAALISAMRRK